MFQEEVPDAVRKVVRRGSRRKGNSLNDDPWNGGVGTGRLVVPASDRWEKASVFCGIQAQQEKSPTKNHRTRRPHRGVVVVFVFVVFRWLMEVQRFSTDRRDYLAVL